MNTEVIKKLQEGLKELGHYRYSIDGEYGPGTKAGVKKLQKDLKSLNLYWNTIDGDYGPRTSKAVSDWQRLNNITPSGVLDKATAHTLAYKLHDHHVKKLGGVRVFTGGKKYPIETKSQRELRKFFGKVGSHQTRCRLPYPMRIAWDLSKSINSFSCHEKVKDDLERIFKETLDYYGYEKIKELGLDLYGGCLNVRKMRGAGRYSTHSWGISVDLDPARNRLRMHKPQANFSHSVYDKFFEIVARNNFYSLGRHKDYDYMHIQACWRP